jgi:hypothetical protein
MQPPGQQGYDLNGRTSKEQMRNRFLSFKNSFKDRNSKVGAEMSKNEEIFKEAKDVPNSSITTNSFEPTTQANYGCSLRGSDTLLKGSDFGTPFDTNDSIKIEDLDFGKLSMIMASGAGFSGDQRQKSQQ